MIPVYEPILNGNEKKYLMDCIDTGWISSEGPYVRAIEERFASYIGVKHGVAVCNGTAAIETALYGIGINEGDEIIMPTFTIISCAIAALRLGAKPVLVDIDSNTWCMDIHQIESKITNSTKAIMPVHIYGHPVDMDPIIKLANKYNLKIVEDAAEVHGAEYKGKRCGAIGDAAAFSFYANKIITTGEGGMIVTNNDEIAERARSYRNLCFRAEKRFYHTELGYNFRMTNIQAAIGVAQIERIDEFITIKRRMAEYYRKRLTEIPKVRMQPEMPYAKAVYWMYAIEIAEDAQLNAEFMMQRLKEKGVETRPFFLGLHSQPVLQRMGLFKDENYPVADKAYKQGLYLPSGLKLTEKQADKVCEAIKEILR